MGKQPAMLFYVGDYLKDTRHLSLEAKGAWMDLLLFMFHAEPRGRITLPLDGFSRLLGATQEQTNRALNELVSTHVCDCLVNGEKFDMSPFCPPNVKDCPLNVTIINRRMSRDENKRDYNKLKKREQRAKQDCPQNVKTPLSFSISSSYSEVSKDTPENKEEKSEKEEIKEPAPPERFALTSEENTKMAIPDESTIEVEQMTPSQPLPGFDCPDGFERIENEGMLRWFVGACAKLAFGQPEAKTKFPECYAFVNKLLTKDYRLEAIERALNHLLFLEIKSPWPYGMRVATNENRKMNEADHIQRTIGYQQEINALTMEEKRKAGGNGQEEIAG